jgi:hypothetical protein
MHTLKNLLAVVESVALIFFLVSLTFTVLLVATIELSKDHGVCNIYNAAELI